MAMDKLDSILQKVIKKKGLTDETNASLVTHHARLWIEEHVPPLLTLIHIKSFSHGELVIETSHSIASQECHAISQDLIDALRNEYGHEDIESIRIIRSNS